MAHIIEGRLAYAEDLTRIFRQVVGAVLLSWQRVFRAGLVTAATVWSITEIVACVVTSSFPPPAVTHLVAVALAVAVGYGVALTLLLGMLLYGGVKFIRQLEGEIEVGARVASVFVQRETGSLGATLRRIAESGEPKFNAAKMAALRRTSGKPVAEPRASYGPAASAAVAVVGLDIARASVRQTPSPSEAVAALPYNARPDTRRDPDDAIIRAPAPALTSLPVLAAHLPRIEWVYDEKLPPVTRPFAPASAKHDNDVPSVPVLAASLPSSDLIATQDSPEFSAALDTSNETGKTATPDMPGLIPRGYRADISTRPMPAITRPLSANTRPLPLPPPDDSRVLGGVRSGGLWERVSQALVGQSAPSEYDARQDDPPIAGEVMPEDAWLNG